MTAARDGVDSLTPADLCSWIRRSSELVAEHAQELTDLDAAIGDADHGTNLRRGLSAAVETLPIDPHCANEVLKGAAMALLSKVGGASGILYGTFLLRMAGAAADRTSLDLEALTAGVDAGVQGIVERGRARAGDKTMLDAWYPALETLRAQVQMGRDTAGTADMASALRMAAEAADAGRADTLPMQAMKGRASYLAERSVGHIDPGAASTALLVQALADVAEGSAR